MHEDCGCRQTTRQDPSRRNAERQKRAGRQSTDAKSDGGTFGVNVARKGTWMKSVFIVLALGTFATGALAGEPDCRAIESTSGRLACYDAAFPPKARQPIASEKDPARAAYKDPFLAEEARTAAKLNNICRGC